ncbi:hypothetical protein CWI84_03180 [Idiomarina tyrosinivorans]|uniref:Divergent polysaccharide deacetylase family protein n=1 Tax=Idiomarina tyrosinivorans TaxID=1445662 RepID=A0A432ZTI0_9GAMM|nr:divergent polysaccharide deacetylase family protein [Idiomarina tyrosinivorans]RUO81128.1 hypothetical protein CWI84_03180 [Idiomarina tyrosinivorans]
MLRTVLLFSLLFCATVVHASPAKLAIVIDDIGNHRADLRWTELPGDLTFAILPYTPFAHAFAIKAHFSRKEVLLHMPMEAVHGNRLGPGAITMDMSAQQIKLTLTRALESLPYVSGMNNHMGSEFTQHTLSMQAVMETLQNKQLFFLDSRTSAKTIAEDMAKLYGVPTTRRNVFLDNQRDSRSLQRQFDRALEIAKQRGHAVLIGHPYPETLSFLQQALPQLNNSDIELVYASRLSRIAEPGSSGLLLQPRQQN